MIRLKIQFKNIILILTLFIISIFMLETNCFAGGTYSVSSGKTSLNVGETTTLTIKVTNCEGLFKISSSDSSIVSISDTQEWIGDKGDSYSITLTAKKAGTAKITVKADNVSDKDFNEVRDSKSVTITVSEPKKEEPKKEETKKEEPKKEEQKTETPKEQTPTNKEEETPKPVVTKSSDASLKSITVGGKKYNNPNTTTTANNVSADISSIKIEAQANDSKAKIAGTGTKELITGTNRFTIKVTAEDGSTKSYTVKVTKLEEEDTTPNIVDETPLEEPKEEIELRLSELIINETELIPKFDPETFEYSIFITNLNEIKIDAKANIEDANIEIIGNKEFIEGENTVSIKLTKDEKSVEYKIIAHKAGLSSILENKDNNENKTEKVQKDKTKIGFIGQIKDWWNRAGLVSLVFASILALMGAAIIFVIVAYKYSKPIKEVSKHLNETKS